MLSKESVSVRPSWQTRVKNKGLNSNNWSEGSMVVIKDSPSDLVLALQEYASRVPEALNKFFAEVSPLQTPQFGKHRQEQVMNAAASSWAHQDPSFPVRFDIGVTTLGEYILLGVKGDYLEGMIAAASAAKAWHQHHFEGMPNILEINFLTEHLTRELQPFGSHASPPSIKDVTIFSSEQVCSGYLASCIGEGSGLKLSEIGVGSLSDISDMETGEQGDLTRSIIKIDPWSKILKNEDLPDLWFERFDTPRAFTFQPPWVLVLDEMIDLSEDIGDSQIDIVLNIWLSLSSKSPVPLVVSSEYKEGYRFENSVITPVVMDIKIEEDAPAFEPDSE